MVKTAILVDGGFYRQRAYSIFGEKTGKERADELESYCKAHIRDRHEQRELYRIFYYDCPPISGKIYHPFLKRQKDFTKSETYLWMKEYIAELTHRRKFCLRMGELAEEQASYNLREEVTRKLCNGTLRFEDLTENNFKLQITQKGVDMKIGIDIASLAYKKLVDQIILISGDSDFVPAAKLARREGIDIILDPMRVKIRDDLYEHIDGMRTKVPNPDASSKTDEESLTVF